MINDNIINAINDNNPYRNSRASGERFAQLPSSATSDLVGISAPERGSRTSISIILIFLHNDIDIINNDTYIDT